MTSLLQRVLPALGADVQAAKKTPVVSACGVGVCLQARPVLTGVTFTVRQGTVAAVLGVNGAGKTTLLRVLATLLKPDHGTLALFGTPLVRPAPALRSRIGYLGHQPMLYRELTALENLELFARLHRLGDARERARRALDGVGLTSRAAETAKVLSRGMAQRLAVARALLHEPDLVLADEPFAGLDAESAARVEARLRDVAGRGGTVVLTSHDRPRALRLAEHVLVLREGRLVLDEARGVGEAALAFAMGGAE